MLQSKMVPVVCYIISGNLPHCVSKTRCWCTVNMRNQIKAIPTFTRTRGIGGKNRLALLNFAQATTQVNLANQISTAHLVLSNYNSTPQKNKFQPIVTLRQYEAIIYKLYNIHPSEAAYFLLLYSVF
jgi:hypothetical protein